MMASEKLQDNYQSSHIAKFFEGKSVIIFGASGLLGEVLLEILLRCCPGIVRIYILLRQKGGLQPEERKQKIFEKVLYNKLKEKNPDILSKVEAVSGDVSQDNLGMSEKIYSRIAEEVTIVFHMAASISFFKPLSFLISQNVTATDTVIDFCRKLNKCEALVFTSTLYSNSNRRDKIKEVVYKLPFKAEEAVRLSRNGDEDGLNHLFSMCNPKFVNYYTFSKCLAENLLVEKAQHLPVSIIRPSLIVNSMKGPLPGYVSDGSTMVKISLGVGKGLLHVLKIHSESRIHFIPVDVAANNHIVAAFIQATKSMPSPTVYNCTPTEGPTTWGEMSKLMQECLLKHPLPNSYILPNIFFCYNTYLYKFYVLIYHYIPAVIIDTFLWLTGYKLRLFKIYNFADRVLKEADVIFNTRWNFETENFTTLSGQLSKIDAEIFYIDMKEFDLEKWISCMPTGCPVFYLNNKPYRDTLKACLLRHFLTYLIKCIQLGIIAAICYFVIFKMLFRESFPKKKNFEL